MIKKQYLAIASALVLTAGLFPAGSSAQVGTKNLQAKYNNIKVLYNGSQVSTTIEPFIVNGTTYIPLRMMAGVFNKDITWDGTTYTINVKDQADQQQAAQLAAKDAQIRALEEKIDSLNEEISDLEDELDDDSNNDDDELDDRLSDLEDTLNEDFGDFEDLEWDFTVTGDDEDDIEVEIEIDFAEYEDDYNDLSESDLETLVEDVVDAVWDEFEDADVTGTIVDSDQDDELEEFEGDGSDGTIYLNDEEIN
jgi:hypothetical protein